MACTLFPSCPQAKLAMLNAKRAAQCIRKNVNSIVLLGFWFCIYWLLNVDLAFRWPCLNLSALLQSFSSVPSRDLDSRYIHSEFWST